MRYMALYMAPSTVIEQMMKATPEQMKSEMDAWMAWQATHKAAIVDLGAPLGKTKSVAASGLTDTRNEITGYSVVEADSLDAAAAIFRDHPHLKMAGARVDVLEYVRVPGM
jgi:hypothetical protein